MSADKLTAAQAELLQAMQGGVICIYMRYMGRFNPTPYYFRSDTHRRCTAQVKALLEKGVAEKFEAEKYSGGHKVRALSLATGQQGSDKA